MARRRPAQRMYGTVVNDALSLSSAGKTNLLRCRSGASVDLEMTESTGGGQSAGCGSLGWV